MNTADITTSTTPQDSNTHPSSFRDSLGIFASIGCAIHCAAMPFVIAYLPALGLSFLADESFHKWMALVCFLIAVVAFIPGIRKHGNWIPISIGAVGLVLITFAAFGLAGECCASCAATDSAPPTTASQASIDIDDTSDQCTECADCSCGESQDPTTTCLAPTKDAPKSLLSILAPWITPLGGLLLVSAHLLNRRHGYLCGCC